MTTLIGWPTTPHTDVKATSFWCHFLLSFLHLMRYKTKMINFSLFVWLKNLKSKIYPFINFLKKQFTLDTPKVMKCVSDSLPSSLLNNLFKKCSPSHDFHGVRVSKSLVWTRVLSILQNLTTAICSSWFQNSCWYLNLII